MTQITKQPTKFVFTEEETKEILCWKHSGADSSDVEMFIKNFLKSNGVVENEDDFELSSHNWWGGCRKLEAEGFIVSKKEVKMEKKISF